MKGFLWKKLDDNGCNYLIDWHSVEQPKEHGGLDINNIELRNHVILLKWWWRFSKEPNSL
ncbi:hypothetical protein Scep_028035 [Stephania cephalantha]|uniref:Uncharacterized protein n=1 Tax=Stephania cephalantha TaxID=152367 RepID=A0AAP0ECL4_9MAGN